MSELKYDDDYQLFYRILLETIEHIEAQDDPLERCPNYAFEAGLCANDLRRIIKWRQRYPNWKAERFLPPFIVQKSLLREGRYGEAAQARTLQIESLDLTSKLNLLKAWLQGSDG